MKAYFPGPRSPEAAESVKGTGAEIVEGSAQTTNSWGLRGPEPDIERRWRGIVLGDSYMQGLFVGDDQTPTECLKRDLGSGWAAPVEVLNTGHLGYSPEQYYYSLVEYAERFPPQFVVVSIFANDFAGDIKVVLEGRGGDWDEGKYWLGRIRDFCFARGIRPACSSRPLGQPARRAAARRATTRVPSPTSWRRPDSSTSTRSTSSRMPLLSIEIDGLRHGEPVTGNPLFNGRIGDGHFSPQGCEVWAERVGRRVVLAPVAAGSRSELSTPGCAERAGTSTAIADRTSATPR